MDGRGTNCCCVIYTVAEVKAKKQGDTLADVKAEAQTYALTDSVAELKAATL